MVVGRVLGQVPSPHKINEELPASVWEQVE